VGRMKMLLGIATAFTRGLAQPLTHRTRYGGGLYPVPGADNGETIACERCGATRVGGERCTGCGFEKGRNDGIEP
jgi:hypothetical protein